jgi:hypothetical protein
MIELIDKILNNMNIILMDENDIIPIYTLQIGDKKYEYYEYTVKKINQLTQLITQITNDISQFSMNIKSSLLKSDLDSTIMNLDTIIEKLSTHEQRITEILSEIKITSNPRVQGALKELSLKLNELKIARNELKKTLEE